jgi:Fe2+ transport system protein FeoA
MTMQRSDANDTGAVPARGACRTCSFVGECALSVARAGDQMVVTAVNDERARVTALRFGMAEGARVSCVTRVPAGPIVLRSGRQEIAVGRGLAGRITVRPASEDAPPGGAHGAV